MSQKKKSKEELFLAKLYTLAKKTGDLEAEIDRYFLGEKLGESTRGVNHTVQVLAKNGLLKKSDERLIYLSQSGIRFVEENELL